MNKFSHLPIAFCMAYAAYYAPPFVQVFLIGYLPYFWKELEGTQNTRPRPEYKGYEGRLKYLPKAIPKTFIKLDTLTALAGAAIASALVRAGFFI